MSPSDQLHIEKREGYHLVVDPMAPNWLATNEDGAWVVQQLRAGRSRDEVSYRYAKSVKVSLTRGLELVTRFADEAGDFAAPPNGAPYLGRANYLKPARLREIWLHVTDRCNLACRHCLLSSGPQAPEGLPTERLLDIIRQACDLGADTFYFTGGEPLLRSDVLDLLREVTGTFRATAVLLTNGALLDAELAARLAALPRERLFLQVSLDGSSAARNDAVRSPGSFEGALRGIGTARAAGLDVTVASVVLRDNLDDLIPLASLLRRLGVGRLHLMWQHVRARGGRLPRAGTRRLTAVISNLYRHAQSIGLLIDNFENARRVVNGDPNIKYDLSNACWDSLAIYRDDRVFPSACLVGLESEAAGSLLHSFLKEIWLNSDLLAGHRSRSVIETPGINGDPWLFLHGGGDPEQAHFASKGDNNRSRDPYLPLHRSIARQIIDETVAERRRVIGSPSPGPIVYHMMGEDGYGCPIEAGVTNGGAHRVGFVHSNCVLIEDVIARARAEIRRYYSQAARQPKTEICQPTAIDPHLLSHIPEHIIARSYGCGSPVFPAQLKQGEAVLDLGCGAGMECFIASRLVGPKGRVIGLDMTPDMLRLANNARRQVAERLGHDNVVFQQGLLEALPFAHESFDAVISNCVVNLSPEKLKVFAEIKRVLRPGGRLVISDIVSQSPLPPEMRFNPRLKGECIAGALTENKLLAILDKLGLVGVNVLASNPWRIVNDVPFDSITVRAWKPAAAPISPQTDRAPYGSAILDAGQALHRPRLRDCLVCGAPLTYLEQEVSLNCHCCGQPKPANAHCRAGHFVCDQCHTGGHIQTAEGAPLALLQSIKAFCRDSSEADPIALFAAMRASRPFPLHGPEHHALVPAAFLTAYRNRFADSPLARIEAAIDRSVQLPGGTCAYWGACAAALGIGIAYSALLRATPLSHQERGQVQTVVGEILTRLGRFEAPRCCRRESYLALKAGCELSGRYLPHALPAGPLPPCDQAAFNRECLGQDCPLHPASSAAPP